MQLNLIVDITDCTGHREDRQEGTNDRLAVSRPLKTSTRIPYDIFFFMEIFNTYRECKDSYLHYHMTNKISKSFLRVVFSLITNQGNLPLSDLHW